MEQAETPVRLAGEGPAPAELLQPGVFSRFADDATETRYHETARTLRLPFVRLYGVIFMAIALAYSVVNPMFAEPAESARLALLLGTTLLVGGGYILATFWQGYVRHPIIDFVALLALSLVVGRINFILAEHLIHIDQSLHAVGVIDDLVLVAFAAVVLAGKPRLFLIWLAADMLGWLGTVLPDRQNEAAFTYAVLSYFSGAGIMFAINLAVGRTSRAAFALAEGLDAERRKNEELVYNMLPRAAVERIRSGRVVADSYSDASVVFIDMVGFSALAKRISPGHLVELLNAFFNLADRCAAAHGVEKVKTVGDSYLAIAGGNNMTSGNSADAAIAFARAVIEGVAELRRLSGVDTLGLRAGIHSGPVVGGVIGATRMAYDYWGDTVNVAARLEATAPVDGIAISESTWLRAREREAFGAPQSLSLKGVGETLVYHASVEPRAEEGEDKAIVA